MNNHMSIPGPSTGEISADQAVSALLDDIGGPEIGDRLSYDDMESLDDLARHMLDERYAASGLRLVDIGCGDGYVAESAAYLDAVDTAAWSGTCWEHAYITGRGWDADSIVATAEQGASTEDIEALGADHAGELTWWCQQHQPYEEEEVI